jgi:hypothetical protein
MREDFCGFSFSMRSCGQAVVSSGSGSGVSGDFPTAAEKLCNINFNGHIHILLVKAISMIYICYIKYGICGNMRAYCWT